ncbi:uncharacterized protein [Spinacia oleracea]|uniref:Uncharacterized protein isoform X2 n=1 Tax=Spinacia oleracea TaxID=3562 RepID=A0ABM3QHC3_SPIOL|nr:uncharacterized protein LOC110780046 isoform X2 [Spinacia oleracea]XP_056682750.1 uncharacterized protein LOC110780046 isoform X2 [Spinacia oleracea]
MESEFYLISGLFKDSQVWPPTFSPITGTYNFSSDSTMSLFEFIERRCFFSDFFRSAADMTNFSFYSRVVVFGAVFSCTGVASCCCRVWVVLLMCAGCSAGSPGVAVRSTGSVVFDCCCVQSYVAYPFIAFVVFGC